MRSCISIESTRFIRLLRTFSSWPEYAWTTYQCASPSAAIGLAASPGTTAEGVSGGAGWPSPTVTRSPVQTRPASAASLGAGRRPRAFAGAAGVPFASCGVRFISASANFGELQFHEGLGQHVGDQSEHQGYHYHGDDDDKRHRAQLAPTGPDHLAELAEDVLEVADEAPARRGSRCALHSVCPWFGGDRFGHGSYT